MMEGIEMEAVGALRTPAVLVCLESPLVYGVTSAYDPKSRSKRSCG